MTTNKIEYKLCLLNKDENDFATNFSLEEILPRIADIAEKLKISFM